VDPDTQAKTENLIKQFECCRLKAYQDSRGVWTIGYGFNLQAHGYTAIQASATVWDLDRADFAFDVCFQDAIRSINIQYPDWTNLVPARQAVAANAMFQLGAGGVREFAQTIFLISHGDFEGAAAHMEASAWAKQTPSRVRVLAEMMRTGEWPVGLAV
jgi:lysozyme